MSSFPLSSPAVAVQTQCREDLFLIPMKYEDSPSEPLLSSHMSELQSCPAIKPRDSESYGSLHTDDQSEDGDLDHSKHTDTFGQTGVKSTEKYMNDLGSDRQVNMEEQRLMEVAQKNQSKHTQTKFCVVL